MANITIIYGSTTGNTAEEAKNLATALEGHNINLLDVANASKEDYESADNLILGTSTWGFGDLQDDWEGAVSILGKSNLSGKKVALFGCGDSGGYSDTFVDGIGVLAEAVQQAGASLVGEVPTEGYSFSASRAVVDGVFLGLPLDDDSASENPARISSWAKAISGQF